MSHRFLISALILSLFAGTRAYAWGDTAAQVWAARSNAIASAVQQPLADGGNSDDNSENVTAYLKNIDGACSGLTGEHIKNGGRNMPVWGQTAQQRFCLGIDNLQHAYKRDNADKSHCKDFRSAIGYAGKAKRGDDPDIVVDGAAALLAPAEKLLDTPIVLTKTGFLGNSTRTFSCK